MRSRQVEVAVGFPDQTWRDIWVSVPEDPDYVLDEDELVETARRLALDVAERAKWQVSFLHILFIEPLEDVLDELV